MKIEQKMWSKSIDLRREKQINSRYSS